ncbi:MAG: helix-turn-helix transcriptional regulator [Clostridiales Family XIII bacterium]|jgi:transcriptional regulator with XRE-family HTH domain|nr:helix-turn-helix transcriptional regulator [Clostridiales Family XIII bacterium]
MKYNIKQLRDAKGWTQKELAEKSNVARTLIIGLETGTTKVTTTFTLRKIADALGCSVRDLFFTDNV